MSVPIEPVSNPNVGARAANDLTLALWMMFLLGRHATFGHEPPMSFLFDDGGALAGGRHCPGQVLPRFPAAKDDNVIAVDLRHAAPLRETAPTHAVIRFRDCYVRPIRTQASLVESHLWLGVSISFHLIPAQCSNRCRPP